MPGSFIDQRWGEVKKESENTINLINFFKNGKPWAGDVLISSFHPQVDKGALNKSTSQAEGKIL